MKMRISAVTSDHGGVPAVHTSCSERSMFSCNIIVMMSISLFFCGYPLALEADCLMSTSNLVIAARL